MFRARQSADDADVIDRMPLGHKFREPVISEYHRQFCEEQIEAHRPASEPVAYRPRALKPIELQAMTDRAAAEWEKIKPRSQAD